MTGMRTLIGDALTPAARAWIRYAPMSAGKPWLWDNFNWRRHAFTCWTQGGRMTGNTEDLIQKHLYFFGTWEPNISHWVATHLKPGDGFIDIGANIGHYSLLASRIVGDQGCVVAIEAAEWIHSLLDKHVALNQRRNIRTVQVAASAARGTLKLFPGSAGNCGKTTTIGGTGKPVDVQALPLSDILRDDEIERARMIKIDVEGAELEVLRGLAPLLGRMREDLEIVMEVSPSLMPEPETSRVAIFSIMNAHGFSASVFDNDYGVETYLRRGSHEAPVPLADAHLGKQADLLFSRQRTSPMPSRAVSERAASADGTLTPA